MATRQRSGAGRTIGGVLRRLRIENLVLIREAELELDAGLNAITGETGAGKTILAQGDRPAARRARRRGGDRGRRRPRRTSRPSSTCPDDDATRRRSPSCGPRARTALVVARRIFADGRTRAYAWGRSAAREDVAAAVERLVAMSGQFEQRRLARPAYQLDVLDAFAGESSARRGEARSAWRELRRRGALTTS